MGVVNWTLGTYGRDPSRALMSTEIVASDSYNSSTTAGNITGLATEVGQVLKLTNSTAAWVRFGATATVGDGFYMVADVDYWFEIHPSTEGTVSIIDVA